MNTVTAPLPVIDMIEAAPAPAMPVATMPQGLSNVAVTPSDLLQIAMQSQEKDIALLERLMAMDERYREQQERERQRAAVLAFRRDFAAFRGENIVIPKTKFVDRGKGGSFNQAEYDQVMGRISQTVTLSKFTTGTCLVVVCSMGSFSNRLVLCVTSLNSCLIRWSYTGFHFEVHW